MVRGVTGININMPHSPMSASENEMISTCIGKSGEV